MTHVEQYRYKAWLWVCPVLVTSLDDFHIAPMYPQAEWLLDVAEFMERVKWVFAPGSHTRFWGVVELSEPVYRRYPLDRGGAA